MSASGLPRGVDVSNYQGQINWDAVAASGMTFAFSKATEGNFFNDWTFPTNWSEMRRVGLDRGAYHFARPSSGSPDSEASFFLASINHAGGLEPGDMLVLDLEDERYHGGGPYQNAGNWALGFCEYLKAAVGFAPIVYWATWYLPDQVPLVRELAEYPLWLASYQQVIPPIPAPWEMISFWQFTSEGRVPGIIGDCDINVFNGLPDRIPLLGKPGDTPVGPLKPAYSVGPGILAKMEELSDTPATNEQYVTPDWSEAYGTSGIRYTYIASLNRVQAIFPEYR